MLKKNCVSQQIQDWDYYRWQGCRWRLLYFLFFIILVQYSGFVYQSLSIEPPLFKAMCITNDINSNALLKWQCHFFPPRDEGEERLPVNRPAIPASSLSRSALHSHRPLGLGRAAHARFFFLFYLLYIVEE